jgi:hypothetical protein
MYEITKGYLILFALVFSSFSNGNEEVDINSIMGDYFDAVRSYDTKVMSSLMHPSAH